MHIDEVNNNKFFKFPQWLLEEPYVDLSDRAQIVFMLLFDRVSLSVENKWFDEAGRVFVIYGNKKLMAKLKCSEPTLVNAKRELRDMGLIEEEQQGNNKPNKKFKEGTKNSLVPELKKFKPNQTNNINTNISRPIYQDNNNNTNNIYSVFEQAFGRLLSPFEIEDISQSVREFGEELVTYALKEAVMNNKVNMKYINGIFNNWRKEGIKTLEQVEENKRNRKRSRKTERDYEYDPQYDLDLIARGEV